MATILVAAGSLAVWANRQVLNANNWADTSSALLQNDAIRTQVADFMVDQVYADVTSPVSRGGRRPALSRSPDQPPAAFELSRRSRRLNSERPRCRGVATRSA